LATGLPESKRKLIGKKWDTDGMLSEEIPQKTVRKPCWFVRIAINHSIVSFRFFLEKMMTTHWKHVSDRWGELCAFLLMVITSPSHRQLKIISGGSDTSMTQRKLAQAASFWGAVVCV
jgi:hypothetical protein